jgi:hypothetical protein
VEDYILSRDIIDDFNDKGYAVLEEFLTEDEVKTLEETCECCCARTAFPGTALLLNSSTPVFEPNRRPIHGARHPYSRERLLRYEQAI